MQPELGAQLPERVQVARRHRGTRIGPVRRQGTKRLDGGGLILTAVASVAVLTKRTASSA